MIDLMDCIPEILTALGALAAAVTLITQLTKNLGPLSRIPTDVQVMVTAEALCLAFAWFWAEVSGCGFSWALLLAALFGGLITAFIAMYGWATFYDLLERFSPPAGEEGPEKAAKEEAEMKKETA